ncbi:putative serine/threonine-protein kinase/receptor [Balamuthia mandrillaris]
MSVHQFLHGDPSLTTLKKKLGKKDFSAKDEQGQTLLHVACSQEPPRLDVIKFLLAKSSVNERDNQGWTALHLVCNSSADPALIKLLVEAGADVKTSNKDGTTPLHYFVRHVPGKEYMKAYSEALLYLLSNGAYINAQNKNGETPLHNAILRGNTEVVLLLLNAKADLHMTNKYGETVMHYAVMSKSIELVEMLLELDIDPRGGSGVNGTSIDVAKNSGQQSIYELLTKKAAELDAAEQTPPAPSQEVSQQSATDLMTASELKKNMLMKKHDWEIDYNELEVSDCIGKGAFGAVYKSKWRGTIVAMKKIHSSTMSKKEMDTFFKEIHTMSRLRHPNIILFLGACLKEPNICFITEFASKGDLHKVLINEPNLPWRLKVKMACDTARGLLYLHLCSPPVVHRDLKSLNLLVDDMYNIKLTDFGISKALENSLETFNSKMGTLNWLAPEVLDCRPYSPAADVYSFGIILWEILTQRTPFQGMHNFQILSAVARGQGLTIPEDCDPTYAALMRDCWNVDPKDRPGMKEILDTLVEIESNLGGPIPINLPWLPHQNSGAAASHSQPDTAKAAVNGDNKAKEKQKDKEGTSSDQVSAQMPAVLSADMVADLLCATSDEEEEEKVGATGGRNEQESVQERIVEERKTEKKKLVENSSPKQATTATNGKEAKKKASPKKAACGEESGSAKVKTKKKKKENGGTTAADSSTLKAKKKKKKKKVESGTTVDQSSLMKKKKKKKAEGADTTTNNKKGGTTIPKKPNAISKRARAKTEAI